MTQFGWNFTDPALLDTACRGEGTEFQRLEFLGDAVAQAVVVPWVYRWSAGSVAVIGGAWQHLLGDRNLGYLASVTGVQQLLAPSVATTPERPGDVMEAVVGAAYLDGGWEAAAQVCETLLGEWLQRPDGVAVESARIDTEMGATGGGRWECRYDVWLAGKDAPIRGTAVDVDPLTAEMTAVADALEALGRQARYVWVEAGAGLRAVLRNPAEAPEGMVTTLLALLAAFEGVWYLPGGQVAFTTDLVLDQRRADGRLSGFEALVGHDLVRSELERFATRPGSERKRLSIVGDAILKAASGIHHYRHLPDADEHELTVIRLRELTSGRLGQMALSSGLVSVLEPASAPSPLHQLIRSALGVVAVDDGPATAVALADDWLATLRLGQSAPGTMNAITVTSAVGRPVNVSLHTPSVTAVWTLVDPDVHWTVIAFEGVAAAIDAIPADDEHHPVLLVTHSYLIDLLDGRVRPKPPTNRALAGVMDRIARRNLTVVCNPSQSPDGHIEVVQRALGGTTPVRTQSPATHEPRGRAVDVTDVIAAYDEASDDHSEWFANQLALVHWTGRHPVMDGDPRGPRYAVLPPITVIRRPRKPGEPLSSYPRKEWRPSYPVDVRKVDVAAVASGRTESLAPIDGIDLFDEESLDRIGRALGSISSEQRDAVPGEEGWDFWAWYSPIFHYGTDWGIFIRRRGLLEMAAAIAPYAVEYAGAADPMEVARGLIQTAFALLFFHEAYHHLVEACSFLTPAAPGSMVDHVGLVRYAYYSWYVYDQTFLTDANVEEGLATAAAFRGSQDPVREFRSCGIDVQTEHDPWLFEAARRWMIARAPHAAPGYRNGIGLAPDRAFAAGERLLLAELQASPLIALITHSGTHTEAQRRGLLPLVRDLVARSHQPPSTSPPQSAAGVQSSGKPTMRGESSQHGEAAPGTSVALDEISIPDLLADAAPSPSPGPKRAKSGPDEREKIDAAFAAAARALSAQLASVVSGAGAADGVGMATESTSLRPSTAWPICDLASRTFVVLD